MANPKAHPKFTALVDTIKQHSTEIARISETMDLAAFDRALHDDWFMVDPRGKRITKKEELDLLRSTDFKPTSIKIEDLHVEVHGDTAVVTGVSNVQASYQGKDISGRYRFTQIYKSGGGHNLLDHVAKTASATLTLPSDFQMVTCIDMAM